jgi:hypothetical protein
MHLVHLVYTRFSTRLLADATPIVAAVLHILASKPEQNLPKLPLTTYY